MPKPSEKLALLRVEVSPEFKARLKGYSARIGVSMGEVLESIASEPLHKLEIEILTNSQVEAPPAKPER